MDVGVQLKTDNSDSPEESRTTVAFTKDTLRGLEGVWVVVTRRESRAEKYGLTLRDLKSRIETQLQQNNIHVMSKSQHGKSPNSGILCVDILPLISEEMGFSAVSINIALMQNVMLTGENATKMCQATTWERRTVALCDLESIREIPQNVTGFIDHFIKDYTAVNAGEQVQEPAAEPSPPEAEKSNEPEPNTHEPKNPPKFMMI